MKQTNKQKLYFFTTSFLALHWNLIMLNKANSGSNKNDIQHRVCDMFRQNNLSCVFFFPLKMYKLNHLYTEVKISIFEEKNSQIFP